MTMSFEVADVSLLEGVEPGMDVSFRVAVADRSGDRPHRARGAPAKTPVEARRSSGDIAELDGFENGAGPVPHAEL